MKIRYVLVALVAGGCAAPDADVSADGEVEPVAMAMEAAPMEGETLFQVNCASCHSVQAPPMLAPPMSHVARHYREALPDREAFVERIVAWVVDPSPDLSLMPERAVQRFGLMPAQIVAEAELAAIAEYIYTLEPEPGSMEMEGEGGGMGRGMQGPGMGRGMGGMMHGDSGGMQHEMPMHRGPMNRAMPGDTTS